MLCSAVKNYISTAKGLPFFYVVGDNDYGQCDVSGFAVNQPDNLRRIRTHKCVVEEIQKVRQQPR